MTQPWISLGRAVCDNLLAAVRREWLVANGLGGYASGTIVGPLTRRYHGLLVAALAPPVERTVLMAGAVEWLTYLGRRWSLSCYEYSDRTIDPQGYRHIQAFMLEGMLPIWHYALADALVERRVWMAYGANTTYVTYRVLRASGPLDLEVTPLVTYRDFHALSGSNRPTPRIEADERTVTVRAFEGARPLRLTASDGSFKEDGDWWWNLHHREETARGLDDRSDCYAPGAFAARLRQGETFALVLSAEDEPDLDHHGALARARERQADLLGRAKAEQAEPVVRQLVLAADQFVVAREAGPTLDPAHNDGGEEWREESGRHPGSAMHEKTVIAGYHWFNDWGRDTMIALPGLTLATGRAEEGADILRGFARYVADGLLPNNFPDRSGEIPGYNTVDATLWYVVAIHAHVEATGETALVDELLPTLREIVAWHRRGTRYGIGVDPGDGLLRAGEPGVQLTWMDALVDGWVVTPRTGKAVEINALWYNALRMVARWLAERGNAEGAAECEALADRARESFRARFVRADGQGLADVVDGPDGDDLSVRPNQIFAVSLPYPLLEGAEAEAVVTTVGRGLLTSYGLRSLSPDDPRYRGDYGGDRVRRDGAYHQGPVWPWLVGAYAEAYARVYGDPETALTILRPFEQHLADACIGSISEILEGEPPHQPRGAIAQAWSVAEVLRVWRKLAGEGTISLPMAPTQGAQGAQGRAVRREVSSG
jgi:predicted glycogen debranching enzyme